MSADYDVDFAGFYLGQNLFLLAGANFIRCSELVFRSAAVTLTYNATSMILPTGASSFADR